MGHGSRDPTAAPMDVTYRLLAIRQQGPSHMKRLAGNLCCLTLMFVNASAAEFSLLEPHSASRTERRETFIVADEFKVGRRIGSRTLSAVGWNFAEHFLAVVERNVPEEPWSAWTLLYTAGDKALVEALGGED